MDIIQQITGKFIEEILKGNIIEKGLSGYLLESYEKIYQFLTELVSAQIQKVEEEIYMQASWRKDWKVVKKAQKREQISKYGTIRFERRHYYNSRSKKYAYLSDQLLGIEKYAKVELGLSAELCQLATAHSYSKSSELP